MATSTRRSKQDTRQIIYDAAVVVFAAEGYHAATTDAIAQQAQVAVGTIYNYFRSKEHILASIFEIELNKRLKWLRDARTQGLTARAALSQFFRLHRQAIEAAPEVAHILLKERHFARDGGPEVLTSYVKQIPLEIGRIIHMGQERGEVRSDVDPWMTAAIIFSALEAMVVSFNEAGASARFANGHKTLEEILWAGIGLP